VLFHEYFDGENGRGVGASHQTGWTALVASLLAGTEQIRAKRSSKATSPARGSVTRQTPEASKPVSSETYSPVGADHA
jgi:hypothetical protein